jgi:hypothetical protein
VAKGLDIIVLSLHTIVFGIFSGEVWPFQAAGKEASLAWVVASSRATSYVVRAAG